MVVIVHASRSLMARGEETSGSESFSTQIAESHFGFDVNTEVCLTLSSPQTFGSNRSAYGPMDFSGMPKSVSSEGFECFQWSEMDSVGDSMGSNARLEILVACIGSDGQAG